MTERLHKQSSILQHELNRALLANVVAKAIIAENGLVPEYNRRLRNVLCGEDVRVADQNLANATLPAIPQRRD